MSMSVKLSNRKAVQGPLSSFVGSLALSSELIDAILDLEVGEEFEVGAAPRQVLRAVRAPRPRPLVRLKPLTTTPHPPRRPSRSSMPSSSLPRRRPTRRRPSATCRPTWTSSGSRSAGSEEEGGMRSRTRPARRHGQRHSPNPAFHCAPPAGGGENTRLFHRQNLPGAQAAQRSSGVPAAWPSLCHRDVPARLAHLSPASPPAVPQMPQNALLKRQACFEFLLRHSRQTANEIKDEYVDTMSKVHTTYFKTYLHRLLKLQVCAVSCSPISSLAKTTCCLCLRQRLFFFFFWIKPGPQRAHARPIFLSLPSLRRCRTRTTCWVLTTRSSAAPAFSPPSRR